MYTKLLLLLFCTVSLAHSDCFGIECKYQSSDATLQAASLIPVLSLVDKEIRRTSPEFIPGTDLVQLSSVDAMERYLLVYVYQNIRGTFLAMASWSKEDKTT